MERGERTFLGGLDWTGLAGKEIMGKSSDRVGGGEEVAGVLEAGVPFPPAQIKTTPRLEEKKKIPERHSVKNIMNTSINRQPSGNLL